MRKLPLEGLKVADFCWVLAGPSIGRVLADYGATVVRVESANRLDLARSLSPLHNGVVRSDNSAIFSDINAGKLSLSLDLADPKGREVARELIGWSDITLESFSPGTMKKWCLDYETLRGELPGLIMLSTCLMGQVGPLASLAGFGSAGSALSGIHYVTGWPDLAPTGFSGPYTDFVAPRFSLVALLAALDRRKRTGEGAYIDISQVETGLQFMAPEIAEYTTTGCIAERHGNDDAEASPNDVYPLFPGEEGEERFIAISIAGPAEWDVLCEVLELGSLSDLAGADLETRKAHSARIDAAITARTAEQMAGPLELRLQRAGIAAHRVAGPMDLVTDPQLEWRRHYREASHPRRGETFLESTRMILSETPGGPQGPGPDLGEHTDLVLSEFLGLSAADIETYRAAGVLR